MRREPDQSREERILEHKARSHHAERQVGQHKGHVIERKAGIIDAEGSTPATQSVFSLLESPDIVQEEPIPHALWAYHFR